MADVMSIYTALPVKDAQLCHPVNIDDHIRVSDLINGVRRSAHWERLAVEVLWENDGKCLVQTDAPWLSSYAPVFGRRVVEALGAMLLTYGELLPLDCDGADLCLYNVTNVLDALDFKESKVCQLGEGGPIDIKKHVFRPRVVGTSQVFKLANVGVGPVYYGQGFVDRWHAASLKGLKFTEVFPLIR